MSNSSFWPIVRTLPGDTTPGQSGPVSDGNEGVLCIPQSSSITGASPSDCLVSYPGWWVLPLCSGAVAVFYSPSWMGWEEIGQNSSCILWETCRGQPKMFEASETIKRQCYKILSVYKLQRCSWCIPQLQPTGLVAYKVIFTSPAVPSMS